MKPSASPWIVPWSPRRAPKLRLFCFPYAGGGAAAFRGWPALLPAGLDVEICAVVPPGREGRLKEAPLAELRPLLDALVRETRPMRGETYAFFGHSLGALVAFELTREVRRRGEALPVHLFVSGSASPAHRGRGEEPPLAALSDEELVAWLRRCEGTPEAVFEAADLLELVLPTLRADLAIRDGYQHVREAPLDVPITALAGDADPEVDLEGLAAWSALTERTFRLCRFPGGHFYLRSRARALLAAVSADLERASPASAGPVRAPWMGAGDAL